MSEQTVVQADPSPATPVVEVDRGALVTWTPDQRAEFRRTGEMPGTPAKEDSAASDAGKEPTSEAKPEGEAETEGATEPPKKPQETTHRNRGAEQRIGQLTSENKRLKAELESLKTPKPAAEPARQPIQQPQPQQITRTKPTSEDKNQDGTPKYSTYEDFVEDLADWKAEQRWTEQQRRQAAEQQSRALQNKLSEAKSRYENFDDIVPPALNAFVADQSISPVVKQMFNDSEVLPDLLFTIASDQKELADFTKMAQTDPGKALRYIALTESLIQEELEGKAAKAEKKDPPAPPKTQAPRPPAEVGGRAAAPPDSLESAIQAGDFRSAKAEMTRRALARMKG